MWCCIDKENAGMIEMAYRVLAKNLKKWKSAAAFTRWLKENDDLVLYASATNYELVLGLRDEGNGVLRGVAGGISGQATLDALHALLAKAVSVARERHAKTLLISGNDVRPSSRFAALHGVAIGILQSDPAVCEVKQVESSGRREYVIRLMPVAC